MGTMVTMWVCYKYVICASDIRKPYFTNMYGMCITGTCNVYCIRKIGTRVAFCTCMVYTMCIPDAYKECVAVAEVYAVRRQHDAIQQAI